jgi:hypothetical protein
MEFIQGDFKKFRATAGTHLGALRDPVNPAHIGATVPENAIIEFDGTTVKYGAMSGESPNIKGAIGSGWFVPVSDTTSVYKAKPAGVRVRPATSLGSERGGETSMGAATEEEQVVGSLAATDKKRQEAISERVAQAQEARTSEAAQKDPMNPGVTVGPSKVMEEPVAVVGGSKPMPIDAPDGSMVTVGGTESPPLEPKYPVVGDEDSSGVEVGHATKEAAAVSAASAASSDGEVVATFKTGTQFATEVSDGSQAASAVSAIESGGPKVEKVAAAKRPATHVTAEDGEDINATHESGATGDVSESHSGSELGDLLPDAAQTATPQSNPATAEAETFVWDKKALGHWRVRVTKAMEFAKDPATLKKILACETPSVQGHIKSAMTRKGLAVPE